MKNNLFKKSLSVFLAVLMLLTGWVGVPTEVHNHAANALAAEANEQTKDHYLFAYFTGTSKDGQTIHLAVSEDGLNYHALRDNEPVLIPSKGVGCIRDPYIWYNEQDNYYYILATDLDFTDGGGDYSENSESFLIWRSKDLIHWYDETMIDVAAMSHLIGDTRNMRSVWAPQVMWDGEAYMVYFSMKCNATSDPDEEGEETWNNLAIVYLRTNDLLDATEYFEYGELVDPTPARHVIDADIIQNPEDGKYYMFYKSESADNAGLQTIYYLKSDNAYGPYDAMGENNGFGHRLYPDSTVNLEGCNSFFDTNGNLITYTDEYEYKNAAGEAEAHFHVSTTTDFKTFTMLDDSAHNINSLSPRHGSVVKITGEEYDRLLSNSYSISSSSFAMGETLEDHLVARYFTSSDVYNNAVEGKSGLTDVSGITMKRGDDDKYYADFSAGHAQVNLAQLFTNGVNYQDGFTITFTATVPTDATDHTRIYEIYNGTAGSRTGVEYYTHFSASGTWDGTYLGNYNGPANVKESKGVEDHDWLRHSDNLRRNDGVSHDYIISYANGNVIVHIDGKVAIMRNRFNGTATMNEDWYEAMGTANMLIGRSGWYPNDPDFTGQISNLCIYDTSMSYYDIQKVQDEIDLNEGFGTVATPYTGIVSEMPRFEDTTDSSMENLRGTHFSNILYSPKITGMPNGSGEGANPTDSGVSGSAVFINTISNVKYGLYYPENTVMLIDGVNSARMPILVAGRINANEKSGSFTQVYPTVSTSDNNDNTIFSFSEQWKGWSSTAGYHDTITYTDGTVGHNKATSNEGSFQSSSGWFANQSSRKVCYYGNSLLVNNDVVFGSDNYLKYNLSWRVVGKDAGSTFDKMHSTDHNIYLINYRPIVAIRNEIAADFDSIVSNAALCPQTVANYVRVAELISKLNPHNYTYSDNTEAAVKACADDIQSAVEEYNTIMADLKTCEELSIIFPAREATCSLEGLTEGKYCASCGKVVKEQETIARTAHTWGTPTTVGTTTYIACTVCGFETRKTGHEIYYENMFHLNEWIESTSCQVENGTVTAKIENGTISIQNNNTTEVVTGASGDGVRDFSKYCIPVEDGTTYVLEYTVLENTDVDIFIFSYDKDGKCISDTYGRHYSNGSNGTNTYTYKAENETAYVELRFDADTAGDTATFANIGFYTEKSYNNYAKHNARATQHFVPGDEYNRLEVAKQKDYAFLGWYTAAGDKVEYTDQFTTSVTLHARWEEVGNEVRYAGNLFSLVDYSQTESATIGGKRPDAQVGIDFSTGSIITHSARKGVNDYKMDTESNQCDTYTYYQADGYTMPVTAGENYVFTFTTDNWTNSQFYMWFYNDAGAEVSPVTGGSWLNHSSGVVKGNTFKIEFTVPSGATKMSFRLGTTGQYDYRKEFSNIGLFTKADYDEIITYKTESGAPAPAMTYVSKGADVEIYTPVRNGYVFNGWYTGKNGTGTQLTDTASLTDDVIVYANWTVNKYSIAFNANGGTGTMTNMSMTYDVSANLTANAFTRTGYAFKGWNTKADGTGTEYTDKESVNNLTAENNATVTLYAQWELSTVTITFIKADGTTTTKDYNIGDTITDAPENTATVSKDAANHTVYSWPEFDTVTAAVTYTETGTDEAHTFGDWKGTEATCTTVSNRTRTCSVCGYIENENAAATGHGTIAAGTAELKNEEAATCGKAGYTGDTWCLKCDTKIATGEEIPATGNHTWNEGVVTTKPTCTKKGVKTFTCTVCSATKTEDVAMTEHTYGVPTFTWAVDNKTCTVTFKCTACDNTQTPEVTVTSAVKTPATCTAEGTTTYTAKVTFKGTEYTETKDVEDIAMADHISGEAKKENVVNATCTTDGSYDEVVYCTVCNKKLSTTAKTTDATGHTFGDTTPANPNACLTGGNSAYKQCTVCKLYFAGDAETTATDGEVNASAFDIEAAGHKFGDITEATSSTCTQAGNYAYKQCTVCNLYYDGNAATNAENGKDDTSSFTKPLAQHKYPTPDANNVEWTLTDNVPTKAEITLACSECDTEKTYTVDSYDIYQDGSTAGDCITPSTKTYTADFAYSGLNLFADKTIEGAVNSSKHTNLVKTNAVDETCTTDGNIEYWTCDGCKKIYKDANAANEITASADTVVKATGHDWTAAYAWADDYTSCALTLTCKNSDDCKETHTDNDIAAKVTQNKTCTLDELTVYTADFTSSDNKSFTNTTEAVKTADKTGHDYTATFTWTEVSGSAPTATVTLTCKKDDSTVTDVAVTVAETDKDKWVTADCTTDGKQIYNATAVYENATYISTDKEITVPKLGHTVTYVAAVTAVCNKDGNVAHYLCSRCSKTFEDEDATKEIANVVTTAPNNHNYEFVNFTWTEGTNGANPTAVANLDCSRCDSTTTATAIVTESDSTDGDCQTVSTKTFTATYGEETENKTYNGVLGAHNLTKVTATTATCTTAGNNEYYKCTVENCGKFFKDAGAKTETTVADETIKATGHTWTSATYTWSADNSTCTVVVTCAKGCTEEHKDVATQSSVTQDQSCTNDELTTYTVSGKTNDGKYTFSDKKENIKTADKTGHTWESATYTWSEDNSTCTVVVTCAKGCTEEHKDVATQSSVTQAQSCTNDELTTYTVSGKTNDDKYTFSDKKENIKTADKLGHIEVTDKEVAATCTTTGLTAGSHCEVCDEVLVEQTTTPKLGHNYSTEKTEANLTRPSEVDGEWIDGYYTFTCANDSTHTTTETVARADYSAYETAIANLEALLEKDITEEAKAEINEALSKARSVRRDLIETEQDELTATVTGLTEVFNENKGSLMTYTVQFMADGVLIGEVQTVISGNDATAPATPTKAPDATKHYTFKEWDKAYTNITADTTINAVWSDEEHKGGTATCTEKAVCTECSTAYGSTAPDNHDFTKKSQDAKYLKSEATCMAEAVYYYACSRCDAVGTETYKFGEKNPANHTGKNTMNGAEDPTCTEPGKYDDTVCECGVTIATGTTIPATGHTWTATYAWANDYTKCTVTLTCSKGCTDTREAATITPEVVQSQTCTTAEETKYTATFANEEFDNNIVLTTTSNAVETKPALGHDYTATFTWTEVPGSTPTAVATLTCSKCDSTVENITAAVEKCDEDNWVTVDCTTDGKQFYKATATNDGESYESDAYTVTITKLDHDYKFVDFTWTAGVDGAAPTAVANLKCSRDESHTTTAPAKVTANGSTTGDCQTVGTYTFTATYEDHTADNTYDGVYGAHKLTKIDAAPATCTTDGNNEYYKCTVENCGKFFKDAEAKTVTTVETETIKASHKWNATYTVDTKATCEADGSKSIHCADCDATKDTKTITKRAHNFVDNGVQTAATCTTPGVMNTICNNEATDEYAACNATSTRELAIDPNAHNLVNHEAQAPTCTEKGWKAYKACTECDYTTYREEAALGHKIVKHQAKEPSCTEKGWDAYETCTRCDYSTTYTEHEALGHDLVHHNAKAPTCTVRGWYEYDTCTRCYYTTYVEIPALGHTEEVIPAVAPTCTSTGLSEGKMCSVCNEILVEPTVVPAIAHTDADGDGFCDDCSHEVSVSGSDNCICHSNSIFGKIIRLLCTIFSCIFRRRIACCPDMEYFFEVNF